MSSNFLAFVDESLLPLLLVRRRNNNLSELLNRILQLALSLIVVKTFLDRSVVIQLENASFVFAVEVSLPQSASRRHKFITNVQVPIFSVSIQFQVIFLIHIIDSDDSIVSLHRHILNSGYGVRHHLLKMMHFINVFLLVPEAGGLVHKDEVFILVVNHFRNVVKVHVL